jgi:hypothetical protein
MGESPRFLREPNGRRAIIIMSDYLTNDDSEALREIRELEAECRGLLNFIPEAAGYSGRRYQHHVPTMLKRVECLRGRCEHELSCFGQWRKDYRKPEEIAEELNKEFRETCLWLARMVGPPPWGQRNSTHNS